MMTVLKFFKTHPDVKLPSHQTEQSACFDIAYQGYGKHVCKGYSLNNKPVERLMEGKITLSPGDRMIVPTGLILDIPEGYSVRVHARSGLSLKQGLVLANAEGVIDSDYVHELYILLLNISGNSVEINNGDRIAQGELVKNQIYAIEQTAIVPGIKTSRIGGMGSTGVTTKADTITINIPEISNEPVIEQKRGRGRPRKNA